MTQNSNHKLPLGPENRPSDRSYDRRGKTKKNDGGSGIHVIHIGGRSYLASREVAEKYDEDDYPTPIHYKEYTLHDSTDKADIDTTFLVRESSSRPYFLSSLRYLSQRHIQYEGGREELTVRSYEQEKNGELTLLSETKTDYDNHGERVRETTEDFIKKTITTRTYDKDSTTGSLYETVEEVSDQYRKIDHYRDGEKLHDTIVVTKVAQQEGQGPSGTCRQQ